MAAPTFPNLVPLFEGPSDPAELRKYLNELVNDINALIYYMTVITILGLRKYVAVSADYDVEPGDGVIDVDASGGAVTIRYIPDLISYSDFVQVTRINKVDTTSNAVLISDGTTTVDQIITAGSTSGQIGGWRDVFGNGTNIRSAGVG